MGDLPTGTVTFLFTDLEGSTRLWREHPEAMRPVLARHDELLRDAIAAHGGHVVKTTGDGAHAVFATASDAIDAAVAAQLALGAEPWGLPEPLRVRMGIHAGPAELRSGDYYGTAVNRAARIMSVAHGGQIVVSLAAQVLVRDAPIEVLDLGEHRLRDLGEPEHLFQVRHPELESAFPPVRSLDAFATNLPVQATSFVGREGDLTAVVEALTETRLVTLTGVGGVGKTRLAVQAAAEVPSASLAATRRSRASTPMASTGYPEAAARIEQVRAALGDDAFDALYARGAAMDSTRVFRYALEQIEEARASL